MSESVCNNGREDVVCQSVETTATANAGGFSIALIQKYISDYIVDACIVKLSSPIRCQNVSTKQQHNDNSRWRLLHIKSRYRDYNSPQQIIY